jgi:hypothetical protein
MAKFVFVTGGVVSSLGKGIAAASLGCLLESRGLRVTLQKCDPYLNVDPGTMSPFQHGEVFVTDDGAETDLDLGHYERFTHARLTQEQQPHLRPHLRAHHHPRTPRRLPRQDRPGDPARHQRDQGRHPAVADGVDVVICEIGGTVGDIESLPFLEAIRQMRHELGRRQHALRPRLLRALHRRRAGAEDQAHAALGEGAALDGRAARHPHLPLRAAPARGPARQDRAVLRRRPQRRHQRLRRRHRLPGPGDVRRAEGGRARRRSAPARRRRPARPRPLAGDARPDARALRRGRHRVWWASTSNTRTPTSP